MGSFLELQIYVFLKSTFFRIQVMVSTEGNTTTRGATLNFPYLLIFLKILNSSWSLTATKKFYFLSIQYRSPHLSAYPSFSRSPMVSSYMALRLLGSYSIYQPLSETSMAGALLVGFFLGDMFEPAR